MTRKIVRYATGCRRLRGYKCFDEPEAERSSPVSGGPGGRRANAYRLFGTSPQEVKDSRLGPQVYRALAKIRG